LLSPASGRAFYFIFKTFAQINQTIMGRGDKKTKKGKIFKGSFGKSRPANPVKTTDKPKEEKKS